MISDEGYAQGYADALEQILRTGQDALCSGLMIRYQRRADQETAEAAQAAQQPPA